ncbi:MAG TPA: hypothetical protein VF543_02910 [Pyrinomonadaceae bacterium]
MKMISRKSARLLAEAYDSAFSDVTTETQRTSSKYGVLAGISEIPESEYDGTKQIEHYQLRVEDLYEFLYDEDYEPWFLGIFRDITNTINKTILKQRLMFLHTGELFCLFSGPHKTESEEERQKAGQKYMKELAQSLFKLYESDPSIIPARANEKIDKLKSQLELDGYIYRNGTLYPTESSVIDETEEQSYLELLVVQSNLQDHAVIKHHIRLAEEAYANKRWSDSISNARNFLEAILEQVSHALHTKNALTNQPPNRPLAVRDFLEQQGFIDQTEKEAISKVYGLISNTGSHPNIAEKDQARLMRHLALTFSQFMLLRWEGYLKNNP